MAAAGYLENANEMPQQHNLEIFAQWKFKPLPNVAQTYRISLSYQHAHCTLTILKIFKHKKSLCSQFRPDHPSKNPSPTAMIKWGTIPKLLFAAHSPVQRLSTKAGNYFTSCKPLPWMLWKPLLHWWCIFSQKLSEDESASSLVNIIICIKRSYVCEVQELASFVFF